MNKIKLNGATYQGDDLLALDIFIGDALAAEEMAIDTMTVEVLDTSTIQVPLAADGLLAAADGVLLIGAVRSIPEIEETARYGDVVEYYRGDKLFGKFYLESIVRTGKLSYELHCVSGVGLLRPSTHYGGLYNGHKARDVIADIVGGLVDYIIDDEIAAVSLYGWLPIASRRDNLRDVLFAIGGQIRKDTAGQIHIVPQSIGEAYAIDAEDLYMGGSVTGLDAATGVSVTEHTYISLDSDEETILFDGESAAEEMVTPNGKHVTGVLVEFSEPIHDLQIQNAEILESGANYAVLSGSTAALLTGKRFTHTKRIITRSNDNGSTVPTIVTANDCALVNIMNAELVAERLMAYYGSAREIDTEFVVTGQKPGDAVKFSGPFGDEIEGYISSMEVSGANTLKASAKIISGFIPTASGNYYSNMVTLTGSGTWTAPPEVKGKARITLIQAGQGGDAGMSGDNGTAAKSSSFGGPPTSYGDPGQGGAGGKGGLPGKITVVTIEIKPGDVFEYSAGVGGKGGVSGGSETAGGDGSETTFGPYTSANGKRPSNGYVPLLSDGICALAGEHGIAGAAAPNSPKKSTEIPTPTTVTYNGQTWTSGVLGNANVWSYGSFYLYAYGGVGGGPAVGGNGSPGGDGSFGGGNDEVDANPGRGGNGFSPAKRDDATAFGSGGHGGHGGGGGGGGALSEKSGSFAGGAEIYLGFGGGGSGGVGGAGGNGGPGAILIYY